MQRKRQISNRLSTQNPNNETSRSATKKQSIQSLTQLKTLQKVSSSQTENQLQKYKFAKQYAKLTKQFQKILNKNNSLHRRHHSASEHKKYFIGYVKSGTKQLKNNNEKNNKNKIEQSNEKRVESLGKTQLKNPKLQNLYNNTLHNQILEAASKIRKNKKKQKHIMVSMLPSSVNQISPLTQFSNQYFSNSSPQPNIKPGIDKQLIVLMEQQKAQKINKNFYFISETLAHFHNLYKILDLLDNYKNNYSMMIKNIKKYIMNNNKADISKLQQLLKISQQKQKLKLFLCLQKIAILGILDAIIRQNELCAKNQGRVVLETVMGVYSSIFSYIIQQKLYLNTQSSVKKPFNLKKSIQNTNIQNSQACKEMHQSLQICLTLLQEQQIQPRKDLQSSIQFLYKKLQNLFKPNLQLFHKIKESLVTIAKVTINGNTIIGNYGSNLRTTSGIDHFGVEIGSMKPSFKQNSKNNGIVNINKFFYFLLCQYAHHMNCSQNLQILKVHKNLLDFFVTCPSPHLVYSFEQDKITVVLQFQSTIAMVKSYNLNNSNKISIKLRPYALQLLRQLSKICEIVLMTTLMPQNIPLSKPHSNSKSSINLKKTFLREEQSYEYEQAFKLSTSVLFRYHYVRYRGLLVKDISRLGRKIQKIILIDSIDSQAYTNGQSPSLPLSGNKQSRNQSPQTFAHTYKEKTAYSSQPQNLPQISHVSQHLNINIQNTIPITTWKGSGKDQQLMYLKELLLRIIAEEPTDVRQLLKKYKLLIYGGDEGQKQINKNERQSQIENKKQQDYQQQEIQRDDELQVNQQEQKRQNQPKQSSNFQESKDKLKDHKNNLYKI